MFSPHTVTIINAWEDSDLSTHYNVTILRGVFLDTEKSTRVSASGETEGNNARLFIPLSVKAVNTAGAVKRYATPHSFSNACNKNTLWTLSTAGDGNSTSTYFVKGEVLKPRSLAELKAADEMVFDVTSVKLRDFGSEDMRHWEVSGR